MGIPVNTREDIIDEMIPRRTREKTLEVIRQFQETDTRTRLVRSKDYGFKKELMLLIKPDVPESEIERKFSLRLGAKH